MTFEVIFNHGELKQVLFLPVKPLEIIFKGKMKDIVLRILNGKTGLFEMVSESCDNIAFLESKSKKLEAESKDLPLEENMNVEPLGNLSTNDDDLRSEASDSVVMAEITIANVDNPEMDFLVSADQDKVSSVTNQSSDPCPSQFSSIASPSSISIPNLHHNSSLLYLFSILNGGNSSRLSGDSSSSNEPCGGDIDDCVSSGYQSTEAPKERDPAGLWMKRCAICFQEETGLRRFYRFPTDPVWSDRWAETCGLMFKLETSCPERVEKFRICSEHFEASDFDEDYWLSSEAVPSKLVSNPGKGESKRSGFPDISLDNNYSQKKSMGHKCELCKKKRSRHRILHRFPRDPDLSDKWAKVCNKDWITKASLAVRTAKRFICTEHFGASDYINTKLQPGVVPFPMPAKPETSLDKSMVLSLKEKLRSALNKDLQNKAAEVTPELALHASNDLQGAHPLISNMDTEVTCGTKDDEKIS